MSMPQITIVFGLALIAIGLTAYFGSDLDSKQKDSQTTNATPKPASDSGVSKADDKGKKKRSAITGLAIPGAFGVLLLISGAVAMKESLRKHAMHVAVMVGTLGAVATIGKGGVDLVKLASGGDVNTRALSFVLLMAVVCSGFVVICVKSFIAARKKRELEEAAAESTEA